jgi:parallel beta-helix repeat protein
MKTKNNLVIPTLIAVAVAVSILVAFSATASAETTWYVDDDCGTTQEGTTDYPYCTIQTAIGAAVDGDTIEVAAGTYTENVAVNKQVTLLGANQGVGPDELRVDESIIEGMVTITADGATVNGFKLTSSYIAAGYTSAQNVDISYNILENVVATWGAIHLHGSHQCDGAYVGHNTISGAQGHGIWTVGNDDVTIECNHVLDNTGDRAIEALNHVGTGIVIHANTITNSGGKGINYWAEDGGVITDNVITNSNYEAIYTDAQATISGNQISGGDMYGILVVAWTSGTAAGSTVSGNTISNTNWEGIQSDVPVIITNNDISGGYNGIQLSNAASGSVIDGNNIHDNQFWGLSILDSVTDVIVQNNQLSYNPYCGVIVWGADEGSGILINCNEITGNGIYGVESKRTTSDVDATQNWWGYVSGPFHASSNPLGTGDAVSDNVDFEPWSFTPDPCEAKTIGFWKNHEDSVEAVLALLLAEPISLGSYPVSTPGDAQAVFNNAKNKNANTMLAAQLLAAELNVLHLTHLHIVYCVCIEDVIDSADMFLTNHGYNGPVPGDAPSGLDKQKANGYKDDLDEYNQGVCPCT